MITASYNTMHQVSLPRFSNSSNVGAKSSTDGNLAAFLFGSTSDEGMDFDLLAEYLLDDPVPSHTISGDIPQVATPDSLDFDASQADPLADAHAQLNLGHLNGSSPDIASDLAQVQQMIAQHAAQAQASAQAQQSSVPLPAPAPANAPIPETAHIVHQVAHLAAAPAPQTSTLPMSQMTALQSTSAPHTILVQQHHVPVTGTQMSGTKRSAPASVQYDQPTLSPSGRRPKSEAQISRRRERNRILARRTRLRKKFFFESLQKEVMDLQRENNALREIAKRNLDPVIADKLLSETGVELPDIVMENCGDATELDKQDFSLIRSLQGSQQSFVITDPSLHDNPIVYASEGFLGLTGYNREEVLGRNCRFLQGTQTSNQKVEQIKKAISMGEDVSVCLANYTADGTPFWNQLFIAALRDANNNIVNFVGVLIKVAGPSPDDPEHGKVLSGANTENEDAEADYEETRANTAAEEITDAVMFSVPSNSDLVA